MNHIYYYEKSSWDNGWRQGKFKDYPIPASVLTYPITANMKPFYWWPYIWASVHWEWNSYRILLEDNWTLSVINRLARLFSFILLIEVVLKDRIMNLVNRPHFILCNEGEKEGKLAWLSLIFWGCLANYIQNIFKKF